MVGKRLLKMAALIAAAAVSIAASPSGLIHYAPDEAVNIENDSSTTVTVALDGVEVCSIEPNVICTATIQGPHDEAPHSIVFDDGARSATDTVSIGDCHWNWNGVKTFSVSDARIHFDCEKNITTTQLLALCGADRDGCQSIVRSGIALELEDPGPWRECFARFPNLTAPAQLGPLTPKIVALLSQHPELANSDAQAAVEVVLYQALGCSL